MNKRRKRFDTAAHTRQLGAVVYGLNLLDLGCTLLAMRLGVKEMNPLLQNAWVLMVYKIVLVGVLAEWLSGRREAVACAGLKICEAVYGFLGVYHLFGLLLIGEIYA